jgi:hypothetical protein
MNHVPKLTMDIKRDWGMEHIRDYIKEQNDFIHIRHQLLIEAN